MGVAAVCKILFTLCYATMPFSLTQSAANKSYISLIVCFALISIFGLVERLINTSNLLMPIVPLYLAILAAAVALLLLLLIHVKNAPTLHKIFPPIVVGASLLLIYLQLGFWNITPLPDTASFKNPSALGLSAIMLFAFCIALALRWRYPMLTLDMSKLTFITCTCIVGIGLIVWYSLGYNSIKLESDNARKKIQLTGMMINKTIDEQIGALGRIKARVDGLSADNFTELSRIDMQRYIADYEIIEGMIIFDSELNVIDSSSFGQQFYNEGMFSQQPIQAWLNTPANELRLAANSASLQTPTPIIMVSIPVNPESIGALQIVALLNMNALISNEYIDYLDSVQTYLEFSPTVLLSMHGASTSTSEFQALQDQYHHSVTDIVRLLDSIDHKFHSFISDYSGLQSSAQLHQLMLWLTGTFCFIFILAVDTTKQLRKQTESLYRMARYDDITGLLRRDAFNQDIDVLSIGCAGCRRAVIFVNLDNFNSINDGLGHDLGDQLLRMAAQRIADNAHEADAKARFSNDEFILYYKNTTAHKLKKAAKAILNSISDAFIIGEIEIHITASAGISVSSHPNVAGKTIIQQADVAVADAKQHGGNQFSFYKREMHQKHERLVHIRTQLQIAMDKKSLEMFYQPIYSATSGEIVSVESLIRWKLDGVFISPAEFIPIAEKTGQIVQLGEFVVATVLNDIAVNPALRNITVAINVSPQQLQGRHFLHYLEGQIALHNIQPKQLILELTETAVSENDNTIESLREMRERGFHIAIDDFGTGFSSLSYLANQPADIIKIDRAFTHGVESLGKERELVSMMINMCQQLNKNIVVEGIETKALAQYFSGFGDIKLQGYFFAKPMRLPELISKVPQ